MTVTVDGFDPSAKVSSFSELKVDARLSALYTNFKAPTPIQQHSWPALLAKRDVVGISETGSGKTLSFSLPILHRIFKKYHGEDGDGRGKVRWVTIAPTRELALQTFQVISAVIPAACVYGGVPRREQVALLRQTRPVAIVGTPGRLSDLLEGGELDFSQVRFLVLDEADRMLDAGFEPAVHAIVACMPASSKRQTVLFSATWPVCVQKMAAKYMRPDPVRITCSSRACGDDGCALQPQANVRIEQVVHVVEEHEKDTMLVKYLRQSVGGKAIVFVLYKKEAPRVEAVLRRAGLGQHVRSLHGDMTQADRTAALDAFRSGKTCSVLIATDVAARGLDIPAVSLVFNYTFPLTVEDYVHRIGRTGRGGADGKAVTLFTEREKPLAGSLQLVLKRAGQPIPDRLAAFGCTTKKRVHKDYGSFFNDNADLPPAKHVTFDSD